MGLEKTKTIHRVIVHADDANTVYAVPSARPGVRILSEACSAPKTAANRPILFVNDSTGCADLIVDPTNPNKLFAAMWSLAASRGPQLRR